MKHYVDSLLILMVLGVTILIGVCILSAYDMLVPDDSMACHVEWPLLLDKTRGISRPAVMIEGNSKQECEKLKREYPEAKIIIDN